MSRPRVPKLVLFDIDGTLIDSGRAGVVALTSALEDLTGISDGFRGIRFAGRTDLQIVREALDKLGLPCRDGWMDDFIDAYLSHLRVAVQNPRGHVKPGVETLLRVLTEEPDIFVGLLTGNMSQGAYVKLSRFSLHTFFPYGAFGDDSEDRNLLLPVAVERFTAKEGIGISYRHCVVVGDTPLDVACARIHGAPSIAVATGFHSIEELEATNPDKLLPDLTDTEDILTWIRAELP